MGARAVVLALLLLVVGCSPVAAQPPEEPDFAEVVEWEHDVYAGVILIYPGGLEFAHPVVGIPEKAPFVAGIVREGNISHIWTEGAIPMKYTIQTEPTMYRLPMVRQWLPVVEKTWNCEPCN